MWWARTGRRRWAWCSSMVATDRSPRTATTRRGRPRSQPGGSWRSMTCSPTRPRAAARPMRSIRGRWSRGASTRSRTPGAARSGSCAAGHNRPLEPVELLTMAVKRLNHAVLYVSDVDRAVSFYEEALGFRVVMQMPGAAFLKASGSDNDHDLGLFGVGPGAGPSQAGQGTVGLYHLAWEVETLGALQEVGQRLGRMGA